MLPMVMAAAERKMLFRPHDLRTDLKLRSNERIRYLGGMHAGMPNIGHISGEKLVRSAPIGLMVIGYDTDLPLPSQPRPLPPLRVVLYSIGRIGHHEEWLRAVYQACDMLGRSRIAAEHAMRAADPQIA